MEQYQEIVQQMVESVIKTITGPAGEEIIERVKPTIDQRIKEEYGYLPEVHNVHVLDKVNKIIGNTHERFDDILNMIANDIPVYLIGEAGCGKNIICKQVAEALKLDFYFTNAITQEYKLTGFIDANGNYQETQFYKAFTQGGLFFLDELDASIPEVLVILNAAIANKYFDFPIGKFEAHPNFRVIAAGNTFGTGANNNYTGRYCLDRASLDRFCAVRINYSEKIETIITKENNELLDFCHIFRKVTESSGINCIFSYRSLERITCMESFMPLTEVLKSALLKELDEDSLKILYQEINDKLNQYNKYLEALHDIVY